MINSIPEIVSVLLIPTAVGRSSIGQWLYNESNRSVKLFANLGSFILTSNRTIKTNLTFKFGLIISYFELL